MNKQQAKELVAMAEKNGLPARLILANLGINESDSQFVVFVDLHDDCQPFPKEWQTFELVPKTMTLD